MPPPFRFVGYRPDGTTVTHGSNHRRDLYDGLGPIDDFQTFQFGPEFTGLERVEIPNYGWSLDNLIVRAYEPTALLFGKITSWGSNTYGQNERSVGLKQCDRGCRGTTAHSLASVGMGRVTAWGDNQTGELDVPLGL
jgi:hypothetical protein